MGDKLIIRHEPGANSLRFAVQRVDANGARSAPAVELTDPLAQVLEGTELRLGPELAWYLESYLDYPFGPNQQRAERVLEALGQWGRQAFGLLFGAGQAHGFYHDATRNGYENLHLVIASDDAHVLSWPWEVLEDPQVGDLAQHCRIERQLDHLADPPPPHAGLSHERVHVLLVTARPYRDDVAYRSISRPLVELIHDADLPAQVKVLRPPTFEALRRELQAHPGGYHIVHFDGHGGFGQVSAGNSARFAGPQGQLVFEHDDGSAAPVTAAQLSQLMREHRIPIVVLNACQSAMLTAAAEDAFASVATALLKAGVRSVVAMGYALYVSAAKEFLPAFYQRLFDSGSVAEATRAGRQKMLERPQRQGGIVLHDWLVPVLYQQDPLALSFDAQAPRAVRDAAEIPEEARIGASHTPHGLIGRDSAVLALERASRRPPAGLLVHGLGGVGKTTLARGYIEWLAHTQGLPHRIIWQSLAEVRSFDYLRNRLVEELFGTNAMALPDTQKWPALTEALRKHPVLIVWDNFESASGMADADGEAAEALPAADRQALKLFLEALRGSRTKVLITSRSDEAWLGMTACYRVALQGLRGEERLALAQAILADQGLRLDAKDQHTADLIDALQGHPLMMRAILPKLGTTSAAHLQRAFEQYVPQADSTDPVEQRLYATLRYVEDGLPTALRPLLVPIGLHEGHVNADLLAAMAEEAKQPFAVADTVRALELLEVAGLVRGIGNQVFELHPALARYLRARTAQLLPAEQSEAWQRAFVKVMAGLADDYVPKELHEQRPLFHLFGGSFERALALAEAAGELTFYAALMQALAAYAQNRRNLPLAQQRFAVFAATCERQGREDLVAGAYHQLGRVAGERHDFAAAEGWYRKSLEINERLGDEHGAASTYHQLGVVAQERRDFAAAEDWYRKSLEIKERLGDEHGAASTYHQLGMVAQERRDFAAAEDWYRKSLEIEERLGNEHGAAITYHQLGRVAQERHDFAVAEDWYRKSLEINERLDDEHGAASSYGQLGIVAQKRRDFAVAEDWYRKALEIFEHLGDEHGAASTYHQLGRVAQEQRDFVAAEGWYRKSLEIKEHLGDEHGAAITYHQLGMVAQERRDFAAAEGWCRKALEIFERLQDQHSTDIARSQLQRVEAERKPT
ncbi:MAG: tetratricopeptide repeat protein [Rhodoferax sp.]|nr:tetratricopeptide repeat protein [Rhodoferax sp.]